MKTLIFKNKFFNDLQENELAGINAGLFEEKNSQEREVIINEGAANETGSALGLILSKEFIDIHGGEIGVKSEVGKGTVFSITLPNS